MGIFKTTEQMIDYREERIGAPSEHRIPVTALMALTMRHFSGGFTSPWPTVE
jgi:hypothetical protein